MLRERRQGLRLLDEINAMQAAIDVAVAEIERRANVRVIDQREFRRQPRRQGGMAAVVVGEDVLHADHHARIARKPRDRGQRLALPLIGPLQRRTLLRAGEAGMDDQVD